MVSVPKEILSVTANGDKSTMFIVIIRDMSNNGFDASDFPTWYLTLQSLTTM